MTDTERTVWTVLTLVAAIIGAVYIYDYATREPSDEWPSKTDSRKLSPPVEAPVAPTPPAKSRLEGPTCTKGCRCGNTCIQCSKKCRL